MNDKKTIGCEQALKQLLTYLDDELPERNRDEVAEHLQVCRSCWSRAEFERRLKGQLAELRSEPVRPQLQHRIRQLMTTGRPEEGG